MDCNNGRLYEFTEAEVALYQEALEIKREGRQLAALSERQYEALKPMGATQRKGYMRNQPCVCGSGVKFKRCCWSKYA